MILLFTIPIPMAIPDMQRSCGYTNNNDHVHLPDLSLEPISKSPEEDNKAGELDKAEEVLGVVLPADEDATLPLYPSEETLDEPPSHITAQAPPILSGRLGSVGPVRRDHFDAVLSQLLIQRIAVIGAIADQILRLGFDHVEVEAQLHQADLVMVGRMRADRQW